MNMASIYGGAVLIAGLLAPLAARAAASGITGITIAGSREVGTFNGVKYVRTWGNASGVVDPGEKVEGLAALPKNARGDYRYTSPFEIIAPERQGATSTILVEVENRGRPIMIDNMDGIHVASGPAKASYPNGLGNGFLERNRIAYARVAWQTGISPGVPAAAQGVGEVIVRDFARLLAGNHSTFAGNVPAAIGHYRTLLLGGISQSAWFVNTFIAEGFNANPVTGNGVFAGAVAIDGTGNWLALNRLAAAHHAVQVPYFAPDAVPLTARELLKRPKSDPFYVDVANYTDFYRLRASLTDTTSLPNDMRRYDWPSPHHPVTTAADVAQTFSAKRPGGACNHGVKVPLNPTPYNSFLRAVVVELAHQVGSDDAADAPPLPSTSLFKLGLAPNGTKHFNPMPGVSLEVPVTGKDAQPEGGVRFPEVVVPLGRPVPVSLPPVITSKITGVCGNIGQWQPFTKSEAAQRYGSSANFLSLYGQSIDRLVATGYLLSSQKGGMLLEASSRYADLDRP